MRKINGGFNYQKRDAKYIKVYTGLIWDLQSKISHNLVKMQI